jgi:alkanesulfonate monooxygenase SsuD/methylene tetrahydromethanopterin reductase-like flavin-dependent oxidoreductase (luciferase family)
MKFGVRASEGSVGFEESLRQVKLLDALGFYTVFVGHHYGYADYWSSPMTVLAAYATATERIRLGTAILILPLLPRLQVANDLLSLDEISGGRAILGVAAGWGKEEFEAFGIPITERKGRLEEGARLIKTVLTQEHPMFQGNYYRLDGLARTTAPASFPYPPLWIGGSGGYSLRLAAELDAAWLPPTVMSLAGLQTHFDVLAKERGPAVWARTACTTRAGSRIHLGGSLGPGTAVPGCVDDGAQGERESPARESEGVTPGSGAVMLHRGRLAGVS